MVLLRRLKGFPGHPSHPPLTDVAIGAYTIAVALLVLGALGLQEPAIAHGALLALSGGLLLAPLTILTGLLDRRELPSGTPKRKLANLHLGTMLAATGVFVLSWFPGRAGYEDGRVHAAALLLALAGEALLLAGGYLGGTLVYVHGHRVLSQPQTPVGEALRPGRLSPRPHAVESARSGRGNPRRPGKDLEEATAEAIIGGVHPLQSRWEIGNQRLLVARHNRDKARLCRSPARVAGVVTAVPGRNMVAGTSFLPGNGKGGSPGEGTADHQPAPTKRGTRVPLREA
jgi:uncharacterized membrane protein